MVTWSLSGGSRVSHHGDYTVPQDSEFMLANPSVVRQFCHWLTIRDIGLTFDRNKSFRKRFTDIAGADSSAQEK
jgi:hypothetical protein